MAAFTRINSSLSVQGLEAVSVGVDSAIVSWDFEVEVEDKFFEDWILETMLGWMEYRVNAPVK